MAKITSLKKSSYSEIHRSGIKINQNYKNMKSVRMCIFTVELSSALNRTEQTVEVGQWPCCSSVDWLSVSPVSSALTVTVISNCHRDSSLHGCHHTPLCTAHTLVPCTPREQNQWLWYGTPTTCAHTHSGWGWGNNTLLLWGRGLLSIFSAPGASAASP